MLAGAVRSYEDVWTRDLSGRASATSIRKRQQGELMAEYFPGFGCFSGRIFQCKVEFSPIRIGPGGT